MDKEALRARLLDTFRAEALEHLQAIARAVEILSETAVEAERAAAIENAFRVIHTLKGAARSVSVTEIESLAQGCEAALSSVKRGQREADAALLRDLHTTMDEIRKWVVETDRSPAPSGARTPPTAAQTATVRTATAKLDDLLRETEELLGLKLAIAERASHARRLLSTVVAARRGPHGRSAKGAAEAPALRTIEAEMRRLVTGLDGDRRAASGFVAELQSQARGLRMSPIAAMLEPFPQMIREIASGLGKEVEWRTQGESHELDRRIIEAIKDPLIHLVRNAVDHGAEPPEARVRAGKPRACRISLSAERLERGRVRLTLSDDGRGFDPDDLRAAAVRARMLSAEEADALSDEDALDLAWRSGLSTSPVIGDISGHGLGLPIVRERLERLGGTVAIESRKGTATSVHLTIPSRLTTFEGLVVTTSGETFLLPAGSIARAIRVETSGVHSVENREVLPHEGRTIPFARLNEILGLPPATDSGGHKWHTAVIVGSGPDAFAVAVDEVAGYQEVLVKDFEAPLLRVRHFASAGLLGSGRLALILRPVDLARAARQGRRPTTAAEPRVRSAKRLRVLVVDDSITTRTMEKNLLEAAGYEVRVAVDGLDALAVLGAEPMDLVVSDVDMPGVDGFELTQRIRADERLSSLPVVLVTALESREHKEKGILVGANAYVLKSGFDQSRLLEIIGRLA